MPALPVPTIKLPPEILVANLLIPIKPLRLAEGQFFPIIIVFVSLLLTKKRVIKT